MLANSADMSANSLIQLKYQQIFWFSWYISKFTHSAEISANLLIQLIYQQIPLICQQIGKINSSENCKPSFLETLSFFFVEFAMVYILALSLKLKNKDVGLYTLHSLSTMYIPIYQIIQLVKYNLCTIKFVYQYLTPVLTMMNKLVWISYKHTQIQLHSYFREKMAFIAVLKTSDIQNKKYFELVNSLNTHFKDKNPFKYIFFFYLRLLLCKFT